jgi:hypothetical protein
MNIQFLRSSTGPVPAGFVEVVAVAFARSMLVHALAQLLQIRQHGPRDAVPEMAVKSIGWLWCAHAMWISNCFDTL